MSWMGKILGGGIGLMFGGPAGAVLGMLAGHHALDSGRMTKGLISGLENKQTIYFVATFSMLGKLAKADGVVTQQEVDAIDRVMTDNLRLSPKARKFAIEVFNTAKESDEKFEGFALQFYQEFGRVDAVLSSVIDLLLLVAHADGRMDEPEERLILDAVKIFKLENRYQQLKSRFSGLPDDINRYYAILGAKPDDDMRDIKKKYRKLAMEFHPDRVQSKGVSPEFAAASEDKFKEIQNAFDLVEKDQAGR